MAEVDGGDAGAAGEANCFGGVEAAKGVSGEAGGHGGFCAGGEEDVFVYGEVLKAGLVFEGEFAAAGEALKFVAIDLDAAEFVGGDFGGGYFVVLVVLAGETHCTGLELHVDVFGDEDDFGFLFLMVEVEGGGDDAVIDFVLLGEGVFKGFEPCGLGGFCGTGCFVECEAEGAAAGGGDAFGDAGAGIGTEGGAEGAVNLAGVGSAIGLFVFKAVELGEAIDGDDDFVVFEAMDGGGVVKEDVRIEDEGLFLFFGGWGSCGVVRAGALFHLLRKS